jgi:flavin reductase (DIM6/NTAB) family NADH-FMN oxidoreductase RutF
MISIDPDKTPVPDLHQYIVGAVAPRPIAFVSTVDIHGNVNLAPYSFFNAFSSNPPILVFSSNRRVENNTTKDTLANVEATMEAVINVVNYDIVRQMSLSSVEFPKDVNEFDKAGLTQLASEIVKAPRVKESPVQMECKVQQIIPLGDQGGAGHLIVCRVVRMHISEDIMDENRINPEKIDLMGRMGRAYYSRSKGDISTIFQAVKPVVLGFDNLPSSIINSTILTGNDIAQFASLYELPLKNEIIEDLKNDIRVQEASNSNDSYEKLHIIAKEELEKSNVQLAVKIAMYYDLI